MSFRNFDNNWGWLLRWMTPPLILLMGSAMLYFRSEFFTRAESLELLPIPAKVQVIERDMEPLKPLPIRVQILEQQAVNQLSLNAKRDTQIETMVSAINSLATQQAVAISKIEDIRKQNERMESKLDSAARRPAN